MKVEVKPSLALTLKQKKDYYNFVILYILSAALRKEREKHSL